jgi:hypothetical protein
MNTSSEELSSPQVFLLQIQFYDFSCLLHNLYVVKCTNLKVYSLMSSEKGICSLLRLRCKNIFSDPESSLVPFAC